MVDAPSIIASTEDHRHSQFIFRTLGLTTNSSLNELHLNEIGIIGAYLTAKFLPAALAFCIFRTRPIKALSDIFPAYLYGTAKSAAQRDILGV